MSYEELRQRVINAARDCARKGPGYSQQRPVFDKVATELGEGMDSRISLELQQEILTCWHDLFREGELSWGYDLDNPDAPFFHLPQRVEADSSTR